MSRTMEVDREISYDSMISCVGEIQISYNIIMSCVQETEISYDIVMSGSDMEPSETARHAGGLSFHGFHYRTDPPRHLTTSNTISSDMTGIHRNQ